MTDRLIKLCKLSFLSVLLCGFSSQSSFALDTLTHPIVYRTPTLEITTPSKGQSLETSEVSIRWTLLEKVDDPFLGLALEYQPTGKTYFYGDAFSPRSNTIKRIVGGIPFGDYRVVGYYYNYDVPYTLAGKSDVFEIRPSSKQSVWTSWDQAEAVCQYFSKTDNYIIEDVKDLDCASEPNTKYKACEIPPYFWMPNKSWALLDLRPSRRPEDNILIQVRCASTDL